LISEIHHVALAVRDLERSLAFYTEVLGFRKSLDMRADDPVQNARLMQTPPGTRARSAMLRKARSSVGQIELMQFDPPVAPVTAPPVPGTPGVLLLSFEVTGEELRDVHRRLVERGVPCHGEPERIDIAGYGEIESLIFRDPDGVMLELVVLPPTPAPRAAGAADRTR
jgi:catechol 2,3-dioxygenase-like lactoylglutathione lyase family enzyme